MKCIDPMIPEAPINVNTALPSGESHCFDTGYAVAYGVDEAIMIRNLQYFIKANANRGLNFKEGRHWTYDRMEDFPNHFPYWTPKQCRRIIDSLVAKGVIIKGDFNKGWSIRTCWYAFREESKFIQYAKPPKTPREEEPPKEKITDLPKRANDNCPNGQMSNDQTGKSIYDTSSITSALSSSSSLKVPAEPMPAKAGEMEEDKSSKTKRSKPDFNPKVREIGNQLVNSLSRTKPDYVPPKNLSAFLTEVDFLLRLDKRDPVKTLDVFNWALADSFWADKMFKPNPAKYLREKFDQLEMKMNSKPTAPKKERRFAPSSDDSQALANMEEMRKHAL